MNNKKENVSTSNTKTASENINTQSPDHGYGLSRIPKPNCEYRINSRKNSRPCCGVPGIDRGEWGSLTSLAIRSTRFGQLGEVHSAFFLKPTNVLQFREY
nr:10579_t:CDS:2 [Entrophospora candida]